MATSAIGISARAPELREPVARLAAAILELPLDEIEGDDARGAVVC